MKIKFTLLAMAVSTVASGCAHTLTEKEKADFATLVSKQTQPKKKLPPSTSSRVPLQAGQWATIENELKDDQGVVKSMSLTTYKVIHVNGDTVTMEVETHPAAGKPSIMGYTVSHFPGQSTQMGMTKADLDKIIDQIEFKRLVMQNGNSAPNEMPVQFAIMTKPYVKNLLVNGYRVGDLKDEACSSEALESTRCIGYNFAAEALGYSMQGHVDAHSAVPIVGFITQSSNHSASRVIAYGMSGATAKLMR